MLGELLRDARRANGWSQRELARRGGTSQPAVARYESGAATPTLGTLRRLLRAAGRDVEVRSVAIVDDEQVAIADQLLAMTPDERLQSLASWAALRPAVGA